MIQHETIELFGPLWWQANLITAAVIALILTIGRRAPERVVDIMTKTIGIILISRAVLIHPYQIYLGLWSVQSSLPLQMCGISAVLSGVIMFTKNQRLYDIVYFWGIPGAFHSLLTPEFTLGIDHGFFYEYFVSHGGIILSALWATMVLGRQPQKGSWWKIFLWSQWVIPVIGGINWLLDANYMYLCKPPMVENPFIVGDFPFHIIGLEVAGLLHFILVYIPFGIKFYRENVPEAQVQ